MNLPQDTGASSRGGMQKHEVGKHAKLEGKDPKPNVNITWNCRLLMTKVSFHAY